MDVFHIFIFSFFSILKSGGPANQGINLVWPNFNQNGSYCSCKRYIWVKFTGLPLVREKSGKFKIREKSGNLVKSQGNWKIIKSQGISLLLPVRALFLCRTHQSGNFDRWKKWQPWIIIVRKIYLFLCFINFTYRKLG